MSDPLLGDGGNHPAFDFGDPPGPILKGQVLEVVKKQDWYDGKPLTWDDGSPKHVYILTVKTQDASLGDDGVVSAWIRGNGVKTLREAAKVGGASTLVGAELTMQHHALGEKKPGKNPAKLYKAKVVPGVLVSSADPFEASVTSEEDPF